MSCGGLNNFMSIPVPATNGLGTILDVSDLVAQKTIYLSGAFEGEYVLLGSHDDVKFVPVLKFNGSSIQPNSGNQTIRRDIAMTLKSVRWHRAANKTVSTAIAGQDTCPCN